MHYVSLDLETTGLDPDRCQVLQIGAVVEDTEAPTLPGIKDLPRFEALIRAPWIVGEPVALRMNAALIDRIHGKSRAADAFVADKPDDAWEALAEFLKDKIGSPKYVVAGKNVAGFDLRFAPVWFRNLCHHRTIDLGSVALGGMPLVFWREATPPALKACLPDDYGDVRHDAVEDARAVIVGLRCMTSNYGRGGR